MGEAPVRHFPVYLDLTARPVVVVGGDHEARRRAVALWRSGADVTVVTPDPSPELLEMQAGGAITIEQRAYVRGDLAGAFLAFCSGVEPEIARAVFAEADGLGCLVNVSGEPSLSSFIVPGVVRRGALQIAVSTGGTAPVAAKAVRRAIKAEFDEAYSRWVEVLGELHQLAVEQLDSAEKVASVLAAASNLPLLERLRAGEELDTAAVLVEAQALAADAGEPESEPAAADETVPDSDSEADKE